MEESSYRVRREKNNEAVKKSRAKTRKQTDEMMRRVETLKVENDNLTAKIQVLTKELGLLKQLFIEHAGSSHGIELTKETLQLLQEENVEGLEALTKDS